MQTSSPERSTGYHVPETAEDAVVATMMVLGRRMRQRHPGDLVDVTSYPLLKALLHLGPMRLSALAALLELDASTVSRHARHLEQRGLLERTDDPDDGRASRIALTQKGTTSLAGGLATRKAEISCALDGWTPQERETLRNLMQRLGEALSATPPTSSTNSTSNAQETSA